MSGDGSDRRPPRDNEALMPREAPPPGGPAPLSPRRSAGDRAELAERRSEARAVTRLAMQLTALERDIKQARTTANRSPVGAGALLLGTHDAAAHASLHGERVRLVGGGDVVIRPVEPADAAELRAGFERLGAVSRYRRFLTPLDHLSPGQLDYLTNVDHEHHEALAALDSETGTGVAIARFIRDADDPRVAEVAVVVADEWQGRGVGAALLERLATRARQIGIELFTARMIVGNEAARRLLARVADVVSERQSSGTIDLTLRLR